MEKGDFDIESLSCLRREIAEIASEIQTEVAALIEKQKQPAPELQRIIGESRDAVSAVMEKKSIAGLRRRLQALFIRLKQREGIDGKNPLYDSKEVLKEADFRKMKRTFWKTVLEILVDPMDRVSLPEEMDFEEGIKYLAIDPSRISRHVFLKFGMESKDFEEQVRIVKEILQNLKSLTPGRRGYYPGAEVHRFYRVTEGGQKGMILGTQHQGEEKYFYLTDIYGALMRQDHILRSKSDILILDELERVIDEVEAYISENWDRIKSDEAARKEQDEKITGLVEKLRHVRNPVKVKMKESLALANFTDQAGRFNPSAWRARVVNRVKGHLNSLRREQMARIDSYVANDRRILVAVINGQKQPFETFYNRVQAADAESLHGRFFNEKEDWGENDLHEITRQHKYHCRVMSQGISFEPFLALAGKFQKASGGFFGFADKYSRGKCKKEDVVRAYVNVFLVTKLEYIYRSLTRLHYMLSFFKQTLGLEDAASILGGIQADLEQFSVAAHIKTKAYSKEWEKYRKIVEDSLETLRKGKEEGRSKKEIFAKLKEIIS